MAIVKYYLDDSHEQQQFDKTKCAALRIIGEKIPVSVLEKLGITTDLIAETIALESVKEFHNGFQGVNGNRWAYIRYLKHDDIKERDLDICNYDNTVDDLMKKYKLSRSQIHRIRASFKS